MPALGGGTGKRKSLRVASLVAATALTVALLVVVIRQVEPRQVWQALSRCDGLLLAGAALFALLTTTLLAAELLRLLLRGFGEQVSFSATFIAKVGNMAIHALMPSGSGSLGSVAYLHRVHSAHLGRAMTATFSALWFKLGWLLLLSTVGSLLLPSADRALAIGLASASLVIVVASLCGPSLLRRLSRSVSAEGRIGRAVNTMSESMSTIEPGYLALGTGGALLVVVADIVLFGLAAAAVGVSFDVGQLVAFFPLVIIGAKLPVTLMGIGAREALVVLLFASAAPPEQLLAAALLFSVLDKLLPAALGLLLTWNFVRRIVDPTSD